MTFTPVEVNREQLTVMGVRFLNIETLEDFLPGLGSAMYAGFEPTRRQIEIARDYMLNKININQLLIQVAKSLNEERT